MKPLLRFAVSGGVATAVHVSVFTFLVEWVALRPLLAAAPAFIVALFFSYGINYHWTFAASAPHQIMLPRFVVVALLGLSLNLIITYLVVDIGHYWYGYALLLIVLFIPLITFFLSRFWVFNEQDKG